MTRRIDKLLISAILLVVVGSSWRQVAGNSLSQNNSLPALSERANGVNSRYLSAASTASLAAATVAASNAVPQGVAGSTNQNQQDVANRNYLLHQQQQQQQQQQQASNGAQQQINHIALAQNNNNNQLSSSVIAGNLQQQPQTQGVHQQQQQQQQLAQQPIPTGSYGSNSLFNSPQAPTYNQGNVINQQQQAGVTPIMSTTYTFNPATGQYIPTELATGSLAGQTVNANSNSIGLAGPNQQTQQFINPFLQQQQQINAFTRLQPQRFGFSGQHPYQQQPFSSYGPPQRQSVNNFNRRTGPSLGGSSSRYGNQNGLGGFPSPSSILVDDDSGFFQQQVASSGSFVNGINTSPLSLDQFGQDGGPYGNQPGSVYNHQQFGNNGEQTPSVLSQSSSVAPVALPTPTTTFTAAFNGQNDYKADQCVAADNRHGTCYQASECIRRGGTPMGKCGSGSSGDYSGSSYVCCLFDITCGQFAAERFVYFRNPGHPNTYDQSKMCRAKIGKLDKGTCQFRLDMIRFDVAKPTNGNCSSDMFVVSGQNENYVIPKICGLNDGQHYYVGVDESGVITLHMMMMGYYRRSFEILITQIPCRSDYAAPAHCLQYFMGTHGTIKSFNYDDERYQQPSYDLLQQQSGQHDAISLTGNPTAPYGLNFNNQQPYLQQRQFSNRYGYSSQQSDQFGGYPNDLDYTMCIRKESGFCSITYQLSRSDQGLQQPFAIGHSTLFGSSLPNDTSLGQFVDGSGVGWHPVSTECRDDYLLIGGVRLCSGSSANNQYPLVGGGFENSPASIQFAQNGSVLNSAGINHLPAQQAIQQQQQQLQGQLALTMQQLARVQQQLQQQQGISNVSYANNGAANNVNNNSAANSQQQQQAGNGNSGNSANNLEQQQAALIQQTLLLQQQLAYLASSSQGNRFGGDGPFQQSGLQSSIITDNTPGPFILRFVSNLARNARGFHIDFRQNPCK